MRGLLAVFAVLIVLVFLGAGLPVRLIGNGLEGFGNHERRVASRAFFHVVTYYGETFLEYDDYTGPSLVLGWHVESVKKCPPLPGGRKPEADSYRAYAGASARIGAYSLFGIPRGEIDVDCDGRRRWESYF